MFDDRLKKLGENKGYSMRQMAESLGMKYTTYVNYEKNQREPDSETLILFSKYFDVTVDYLLGLSEIKNAPKIESEMTTEISEIADAYSKHPEMHHAVRILLGLEKVNQTQFTQEVQIQPTQKISGQLVARTTDGSFSSRPINQEIIDRLNEQEDEEI